MLRKMYISITIFNMFKKYCFRWLCIYWSSCYQNAVQNKENLLEDVSARQGEKTSASNKLVSFHNHKQICVQTMVLAVYYFFFG